MLKSKANMWITADSETLCQDLQRCENPSELLSSGSVFAVHCGSDTHATQTGLHLPRSIPCQSALQRCWNELPPGTWEELVAAHQDYPWEPHDQLKVSPTLKQGSAAQPQLFPRIRWKRQAEVGLKVTLAGKESAAARGSSRTDGDIYIGNKRENS